jgi:hypothetical protein
MDRDTGWFKSSYSGTANDDCIEVCITDSSVSVRDSKNSAGHSFTVPPATWKTFVTQVRAS